MLQAASSLLFLTEERHIARLGVQTSAYCCHIYNRTKVLVCPYDKQVKKKNKNNLSIHSCTLHISKRQQTARWQISVAVYFINDTQDSLEVNDDSRIHSAAHT